MQRITRIPVPARVWLWRGFSLLIAVTVAVFMLSLVDWEAFRVLLQQMPPASLVSSFLVYVLLNYFRACRYAVLLEQPNIRPLHLFPIGLYHNFLVRLLPFKLGEVTYIVLAHTRLQVSIRDGVSSLFGSRLFELLVVVLVAAGTLLLSGSLIPDQGILISGLMIGSLVMGIAGFYYAGVLLRWIARRFGRWQKLAARIESQAASFDRIRSPQIFGRALLWSLFTYSSSFVVNMLLLQGAGVQVDLPRMIVMISLGMFATIFPFSISGFGAVELSWAFGLVNLAGYSTGEAASIGLMINLWQLICAAISGLAGYLWLQTHPVKEKQAAH